MYILSIIMYHVNDNILTLSNNNNNSSNNISYMFSKYST